MTQVAQTLPSDPAKLAEMVRFLQAELDAERALSARQMGAGLDGEFPAIPMAGVGPATLTTRSKGRSPKGGFAADGTKEDAPITGVDSEIARLNRELAERDAVIAAKDGVISEQGRTIAAQDAELKAAKAGVLVMALEVMKLEEQIAKLKRMKFGASSERFNEQLELFELRLADLAGDIAEDVADNPELAAVLDAARAKTEDKKKPKRNPHPAHLEHKHEVVPAPDSDICSQCGFAMGPLGVETTKVLDFVPARYFVRVIERQKCSCTKCNTISIAPLPIPIPRCKADAGLLAHIAVSKFCDSLPLDRQSHIFAREGIDMPTSTLGDMVGNIKKRVEPIAELIGDYAFTAAKLHTDDTPVRQLKPGLGRTVTGRFWTYILDNRKWQPGDGGGGGGDPPAAVFYYSSDRKGERPAKHLEAFSGFLQADGYAGYDKLYNSARAAGPITEVACWAHARRKVYDVWKARGSQTAAEGLAIIERMYALDKELYYQPPELRVAGRAAVRKEVEAFFAWGEAALARLSNKDSLAKAIRYALTRRVALTRFLDDGRLEIDNNRAENSLRGIAVGRKNWLFVGSHRGGDRAAVFYTLFETCKLNNVNPYDWLRDVLKRLGEGHPKDQLEEFLPWNWAKANPAATE